MEKQLTVAHQLKTAANKTIRLAEASIPAEVRRDVTPVQSHIVGYLYHNRERALYQRDVEAEFSIGRATASKLLTAMERNGLIRRSAVAGDARLKKLELTEKALAHMEQIRRCKPIFTSDIEQLRNFRKSCLINAHFKRRETNKFRFGNSLFSG